MEPDYDKIMEEIDREIKTGGVREVLERHFQLFEKMVRYDEVLNQQIKTLKNPRGRGFEVVCKLPGLPIGFDLLPELKNDKCPQCTETEKCNYCVRYSEEE